MTRQLVEKAKKYDKTSVPGNYTTLSVKCPECEGQIEERYNNYICVGTLTHPEETHSESQNGCGFTISKVIASRILSVDEVTQLVSKKKIGPLEHFRSRMGRAFKADLVLSKDTENTQAWKISFDFGDKTQALTPPAPIDPGSPELGKCLSCQSKVFEFPEYYGCEDFVKCRFKINKTILQQLITREQAQLLLQSGKTDLLDGFISPRTQKKFKSFLVWDSSKNQITFKFPPKSSTSKPISKIGI
ncbi:MAG: topoisomerase C-terminal repeat-containing protein [Gammaproteobacteria bacterium]|nr:topoisomerase C-terminal repeat-containing protein [Gammaproteobacteria bacterium]